MKRFDCLIIGPGSGGAKIAKGFANNHKQVAVIERDVEHFGGACINFACIPTKVLIEDSINGRTYQEAVERKDYIVPKFRDSKYQSLKKEENITLIEGEARFQSDEIIEVETENGIEEMTADYIIINTGSSSFVPTIKGLDKVEHVYTSSTMLEREALPSHLMIIGGGYIGLEFAMMYKNFGSKVTIINRGKNIADGEDEEIRAELEKVLRDKGIDVLEGTEAEQVTETDGTITVSLTNGDSLRGDALLFATGRRPNVDSLQIENTSIELSEGQAIKVHDTVRTNVDHIFAVGDVRGEEQFTYTASDDGRKVLDLVFGQQGERLVKPRNHVQYTVFTDPPLSRVGLTEQAAIEQGYRVLTKIVPVHTIGRAYIIDDKRGQFKSVIDADTGAILGVSLFGPRSEELINSIKIAMDAGWHYQDMRDQMINHPVMSEAFNGLFDV